MIYLEKLEEATKKKGRCWTGYKPKPGSVPYSKGSCVKEAYKLIGLALIEAKVDDGLTARQKMRARIQRLNDEPDELEQKTKKGVIGNMARRKSMRKIRVNLARDERTKHPERKKAETYGRNRERESTLKGIKASNEFYGTVKKEKKGKS